MSFSLVLILLLLYVSVFTSSRLVYLKYQMEFINRSQKKISNVFRSFIVFKECF